MITDEEIAKVMKDHDNLDRYDNWQFDVFSFARAIYQLGRQHQRDSDAALCLQIGIDWENDGATAKALASSYLYQAIRNNT